MITATEIRMIAGVLFVVVLSIIVMRRRAKEQE